MKMHDSEQHILHTYSQTNTHRFNLV